MMKKEKNDACINLSKNVREQLKALGTKGETYDSVISNLIEKKSCASPESQNEEI